MEQIFAFTSIYIQDVLSGSAKFFKLQTQNIFQPLLYRVCYSPSFKAPDPCSLLIFARPKPFTLKYEICSVHILDRTNKIILQYLSIYTFYETYIYRLMI